MKEHLLIALLFVSVPCALAQKAKPKVAVIPCRETIANDMLAVPNLSQLTPQKLVAIKREVSDCVLTDFRLSREDLVAAYKVHDAVETEINNRVAALVVKQTGEYNDLRDHGKQVAELFIKTAEQYKSVVADYNNLVEKYNGLLDTYRSNIDENIAFADQMKRILDAQAYQCGTAIRDAVQSYTPPAPSTYKPMVPTQCTAHTISNPITGNWTYMDCH